MPRSPRRSKDAYVRERLSRKTEQIDDEIKNALENSYVSTERIILAVNGNYQEMTHQLAEEVASSIVETTLEWVQNEGGFGCTEEETRKAWTPQARAHTQRWLEEQAPKAHWSALAQAIRDAQPNTTTMGLTIKRLTELARRGPALTEKMRACDAWVACEACWNMTYDVIDGDEKRWKAHAVKNPRRQKGTEKKITDKDAEQALEHWRWPTMRPPLEIVSAGAGNLPPIESDSAWAHAVKANVNMTRMDRETSVENERKGEENNRKEIMREIANLARMQVNAWSTNDISGAIKRCRQQWRQCTMLKGDGGIAEPRLKIIKDDEGTRMYWVLDIHGPETLMAGCGVKNRTMESIARTFDLTTCFLAIDVERGSTNTEFLSKTRMRNGTNEMGMKTVQKICEIAKELTGWKKYNRRQIIGGKTRRINR